MKGFPIYWTPPPGLGVLGGRLTDATLAAHPTAALGFPGAAVSGRRRGNLHASQTTRQVDVEGRTHRHGRVVLCAFNFRGHDNVLKDHRGIYQQCQTRVKWQESMGPKTERQMKQIGNGLDSHANMYNNMGRFSTQFPQLQQIDTFIGSAHGFFHGRYYCCR